MICKPKILSGFFLEGFFNHTSRKMIKTKKGNDLIDTVRKQRYLLVFEVSSNQTTCPIVERQKVEQNKAISEAFINFTLESVTMEVDKNTKNPRDIVDKLFELKPFVFVYNQKFWHPRPFVEFSYSSGFENQKTLFQLFIAWLLVCVLLTSLKRNPCFFESKSAASFLHFLG